MRKQTPKKDLEPVLENVTLEIVKKSELPEPVQLFGIEKEGEGWYFVTCEMKNDIVFNKVRTGPTMRGIVLDEFKIEAQRYFENQG